MNAAIYASGAVCWRIIDSKLRILLIHRSRYNDVSLPKGKVDAGESLPQAAVREIEEETGLKVALGVPLGVTRYTMPKGIDKVVHYWAAEVTDEAQLASAFLPNSEVAALEWVSLKKARTMLSYPRDAEILDNFKALVDQGVTSTYAMIVLRHGKAISPEKFDGDDHDRTLTDRGRAQAANVAAAIAAWGPEKIVTSTAKRCRSTVVPLEKLMGLQARRTDAISQRAYEWGESDVRGVIGKLVRAKQSAVVCSHGPVIPEIIREIALATGTPTGSYVRSSAALETGGYSVVHLSRTLPASGIIAIESHEPHI
ncbi:NUDIX domain-containing protein [Homoserinimonas sp. OAct 916]|uniref:NUDIX hydrolase n=1 Tax=Homoserinimonas sp. OAct 916 TaxID=2211450 RepID=UPI000DBE9B71|nr:NUDIX domain-containing protein [Homoserinimonas sp. OAct 916]